VWSDVSFYFLRPSEPEYTQVRLSHLQYILATSKETNEGKARFRRDASRANC
jgi:hypothetical protein